MKILPFPQENNVIPVTLTENQFNLFVLPHLSKENEAQSQSCPFTKYSYIF
jgi:hypothetical protein